MKKIYFSLIIACFSLPVSFAQTVVVAGADAGTLAGNPYTTLGAAFNNINVSSQAGNVIVITVTGVTAELTSAVLNQNAGAWTSLTIVPSGTAQITGNIAGPLIDLNGADNVTIDGLNLAGNSLAIDNSNADLSATTIRFISDATNNTLIHCNVLGSSGFTTGPGIGTIYFAGGTITGNDNNTITQCNISASVTGTPVNAIYSVGSSAAVDNSNNSISVNNISDYFNLTSSAAGINIGTGNSGWTINSNALYQTATRLATSASTYNGILITSGSGYTVSNNVIGFANPAGTGITALIGNSVALTGTFPTSWNNTGTANATRYIAINCAFTAAGTVSDIQGNTIGGFALYTNSGAATTNGIWCGINVTSGNVNIGTTTGNTIGATSGQGSIYTACNTAGGAAVGIYVTSANVVNIQNNKIGAIDAAGAVVASGCGGITGIDAAGAGVFTISNNTIGNSTANNLRAGNLATGATLSNTGTFVTTTGIGAVVGIRSSASGATLSITGNTLRGFAMSGTSSSTSSTFTGITNTGAVTGAVNIDNNFLGTASVGLIHYAFAMGNNSALTGINKSGSTTATISISNNDFRGITNAVTAANTHTYINLLNPTSSLANVNGNTFTNLNVSTTGNITFIGRLGNMTATAVENVNNNSIAGTFNKGGGIGTVYFFNATGLSVNGCVQTETGNNFSNVTVTGATNINGWYNQEGGSISSAPRKNISNNTFINITGGTGSIYPLYEDRGGAGTTIQGNTISNINGTGAITAITWFTNNGQGTHTVEGNTITGLTSASPGGAVFGMLIGSGAVPVLNCNNNSVTALSSAGAANVKGIYLVGGGISNIFKNKIADLQNTNTGGTVDGIFILTGTTTTNIFNNHIGDLRTPGANAANPLCGININGGTTVNAYYNTIYLNAASTGALFGSSAISVTNTTTITTLRNNIFVNLSVANGAAFTVAHRRNSTSLTQYGSASDNNLFYAGTPGVKNLIFYDGTNSDQTLAAYKARVSLRDGFSVTENPTFVSVVASNVGFLHINTTVPTQVESGAVNIAGFTDDFDNDIRQGNPGYTGTSALGPDIGADEGEFTTADVTAPIITNISSTTNGCDFISRTFTAVLTDVSGVNNAGFKPNIYFRKNGASYSSAPGTLTTGTVFNGTWTFTINYAAVGGVVEPDLIEYFIVAQDVAVPYNIAGSPSAGLVLTDVNTITTPPTNPLSYFVKPPMSGTYLVGVGQVAPNFATLTDAIANYNTRCISGPIVFELQDALYGASETFPISINTNADASAINTLTIQPKASTASVISDLNTSSLFDLNGAKYIRFNGLNSGGSSLLIRNTSAAAAAIRLLNDAVYNVITNSTFESGNSSFTGTTDGAIIFLTTTGTLGNSNNIISYCDFRDRTDVAATPTLLIASAGTALTTNTNNTIDHCNFYNFYQDGTDAYGIYIGAGSTDWTVSNNSFYQTATRTATAHETTLYGIYSSGTDANNMQISGNYFGGSAPLCAGGSLTLTTISAGVGTAIFPIYMTTGNATASIIQNNIIQNISLTSMLPNITSTTVFAGIVAYNGSFNISGNTIGSATGTGSVIVNNSGPMSSLYTSYVDGIEAGSTGGTTNVTNNTVGSITIGGTNTNAILSFRGVYLAGSPASPVTISGNVIGSLVTANSIQHITTTRPATILGITNITSTVVPINIINNVISNISNFSTNTDIKNSFIGISPKFAHPFNISGNTVREISSASESPGTVPGTNVITGIMDNATSLGNSITGNFIYSLHATSASAPVSVYGIAVFSTGSTGTVSKNTVYDLTTPSANSSSRIYGIYSYGGLLTWNYLNNMISLTNAPYTNGLDIQGMNEGGVTNPYVNNYYYNSVYIGGLATASATNTYAFNRTSATRVVINNNIFSNLRTGGTGYHVAMANTNASEAGWDAGVSDYNDLYSTVPANLTQWLGSAAGNNLNLAGWQAAQPAGSGSDAHSLNVFPVFTNTAIADLHLDTNYNCRLDGYGTPIAITTDYDNEIRDAVRPDMGADEFTSSYRNGLAGVVSAAVCDNRTVSVAGTIYASSVCELIAKVVPSGGSPVAGNINACVTRDAAQQYFNGEPYVQRHYDIEPASGAATATATVTLYFTDQEFINYNTINNGSWPLLPTSGLGNADPARGNVRVTQFHGTPTGGLPVTTPGNYAGARVLINPGAANVVWDGLYWAVTIPVNGFSGFYLHTTQFNTPLPIVVNYLTGRRQGSNHLLNWKVTCAATPRATMILERSTDSRNYTGIYTITADAARCNQPFDYTDANPLPGMNYYRLKVADADGKVSYSTTVALLNAVKGFDIISIAPNPVVDDHFNLNVASAVLGKMELGIFDMLGRLVHRQTLSLTAGFNTMHINVAKLPAGTYAIKLTMAGDQYKLARFVKQ